jgi:hypothetical protein
VRVGALGWARARAGAAQASLLALLLPAEEGLVSTVVQKACFLKCSLRRILRCSAAGGCWGRWSDQRVTRVRDQGPADRAQVRED